MFYSHEIIMFCTNCSCKEQPSVHLGTNPGVGAELQISDMESPCIRKDDMKSSGSPYLPAGPWADTAVLL